VKPIDVRDFQSARRFRARLVRIGNMAADGRSLRDGHARWLAALACTTEIDTGIRAPRAWRCSTLISGGSAALRAILFSWIHWQNASAPGNGTRAPSPMPVSQSCPERLLSCVP
jgi:hypothetical protein